jgi:hypothetical protein
MLEPIRMQREVAAIMGISPARIYQIEKSAFQKLRRLLASLFDSQVIEIQRDSDVTGRDTGQADAPEVEPAADPGGVARRL